jgi:L-lactate dehydrogenase complex protein LldF
VKIDIPAVLLHLRAEVVRKAGRTPERSVMRGVARVFGSARVYKRAQWFARLLQRPARRLPGPLATWTRTRELKPLPQETFREWWSRERGT